MPLFTSKNYPFPITCPTLPSPPSVLSGAKPPILRPSTLLCTRYSIGLLSRKKSSRTLLCALFILITGPSETFRRWPLALSRPRTLPVCPMTSPGTFVTPVIRTLKERLSLLCLNPCRKTIPPLTLPIEMPQPPTCPKSPLTLPNLRQRAVNKACVPVPGRLRTRLITV